MGLHKAHQMNWICPQLCHNWLTPPLQDDNKLLTLAIRDRISMSSTVKCCFEPESLANASPATVSRAGIIYISAELVWEPVFQALVNHATCLDADKVHRTWLFGCIPAIIANSVGVQHSIALAPVVHLTINPYVRKVHCG